jgi:hypothetical protein
MVRSMSSAAAGHVVEPPTSGFCLGAPGPSGRGGSLLQVRQVQLVDDAGELVCDLGVLLASVEPSLTEIRLMLTSFSDACIKLGATLQSHEELPDVDKGLEVIR